MSGEFLSCAQLGRYDLYLQLLFQPSSSTTATTLYSSNTISDSSSYGTDVNDLSSYGIDINDPSHFSIDLDNLSDSPLHHLVSIKRWFSHYFGKAFADKVESAVMKDGSITKRRMLMIAARAPGISTLVSLPSLLAVTSSLSTMTLAKKYVRIPVT
jgi:hypothetical protein